MFRVVELTIRQHWFRYWLGTEQVTSHYLSQWWPSVLMHTCITRPQWILYISELGHHWLWRWLGLATLLPETMFLPCLVKFNYISVKKRFKNVICKVLTIWFKPQCVNRQTPSTFFINSLCLFFTFWIKISCMSFCCDLLTVLCHSGSFVTLNKNVHTNCTLQISAVIA